MSERGKNDILRDINNFVKMSVSTLLNFVYALVQKLVCISKLNLTCRFFILRLRADQISVEIEPKLRWGPLKKLKLKNFQTKKNNKKTTITTTEFTLKETYNKKEIHYFFQCLELWGGGFNLSI